MLPLRDVAATTGNARADGSERAPAVGATPGAGAVAAGLHQKYAPPATIAARTINADAQIQRRRTGMLAGTEWVGKSGSGAEEGPGVIVSFAGNAW